MLPFEIVSLPHSLGGGDPRTEMEGANAAARREREGEGGALDIVGVSVGTVTVGDSQVGALNEGGGGLPRRWGGRRGGSTKG